MKSDYRWAIGGAVLLVLSLAIGQVVGTSGRSYAPEELTYSASTAVQAYEAFTDADVRGRVLVVLDERSRIVPRTWMATFMSALENPEEEPPVMWHNLTSCLVYAGIAREVYFVPPDALWETELQRMSSRPDSLPEATGVRARFYGVAVRLLHPADVIPLLDERVIVFADEALLAEYDPGFLAELEQSADVVVMQAAQ